MLTLQRLKLKDITPDNASYLVGEAIWDEENEIYEIKIGRNDPDKTLLFSVWGKTPMEVDNRKRLLIDFLKANKI